MQYSPCRHDVLTVHASSLLNVLELSVRARLVHLDGPANVVAATNAGLPLLGDVDQSAFVAQVYPPRGESVVCTCGPNRLETKSDPIHPNLTRPKLFHIFRTQRQTDRHVPPAVRHHRSFAVVVPYRWQHLLPTLCRTRQEDLPWSLAFYRPHPRHHRAGSETASREGQ